MQGGNIRHCTGRIGGLAVRRRTRLARCATRAAASAPRASPARLSRLRCRFRSAITCLVSDEPVPDDGYVGATLGSVLYAYDSHYYGRRVLAPLNIVLYNVFTEHGPSLYGTQPLSYYLINLILNWNAMFTLATVTLPVFAVAALVTSEQLPGDGASKKCDNVPSQSYS